MAMKTSCAEPLDLLFDSFNAHISNFAFLVVGALNVATGAYVHFAACPQILRSGMLRLRFYDGF